MAKIAPEPLAVDKVGCSIAIAPRDVEVHNLRILSCCCQHIHDAPKKQFFIPREEILPLLFFRRIFTGLRAQLRDQGIAAEEENQGGEEVEDDASVSFFDREDEGDAASQDGDHDDDTVPVEAFQRALERLFCALGDEEGFDAQAYDENGNGDVGWSEFAQVFKQRSFSIKLSPPERIFLTFDNPDCAHSAQVVSLMVLATIVVSSLCFILSTSPEFQNEPVGIHKPKPTAAFDIVENLCLSIFLVEYLIRLMTCWAVRTEVTDKDKLLLLCLGHGPLHMTTRTMRLIRHVFSPSNLIDLIAIIPGVLGWILALVSPDAPIEGGGFVVLRLVRLTRILRTPTLAEPAIVLARTMNNSTKALYLLAFNAVLGILIFGSLMYLAEKGEWDWQTRTYNRYVGREWNATSQQFDDITAESPFYSIPHTFWWAIVTSTTVGYGDTFPTTTLGYMIAVTSMVFSVVIGALPVGVIGGNFSTVWAEYAEEKARYQSQTEKDKKFITGAIQRIEPLEMSQLVYIEVWNERFPEESRSANSGRDPNERPDVAEFLGQAYVDMNFVELSRYNCEKTVTVTRTLKLANGAEGKLPKRTVTGQITVQFEWTASAPYPPPIDTGDGDQAKRHGDQGLHGNLRVTVIQAEGLINLNYTNGKRTGSNPYCRVFCYPNSPVDGRTVCPSAWRMPLNVGTLSPKWNASHIFNFSWVPPKEAPEQECAPEDKPTPPRPVSGNLRSSSRAQESSITSPAGTFAKSVLDKKGGVSTLAGLEQELQCLSAELHALKEACTRSTFVTLGT